MIFYSASTNGFYDSAIHGDAIPAGAVQITAEQHEALLTAQSQGKRIRPDGSGHPEAIDPPPAGITVPVFVSPRQAKLALLQHGLLDQVEAAIAAADRATQITWASSTAFERSNPLVLALAGQLNLSSADLDQLFILAATL